jgi:biotin carboxyl carrier protein
MLPTRCPRCMRLSVPGATDVQHLIEVDGTLHRVWLGRSNERYKLYLGNTTWAIALEPGKEGEATLVFADEQEPVIIAVDGNRVFVHIDGMSHELLLRDPISFHATEACGAAEDAVCAPMPGSVIAAPVAVGDAVSAGDTLIVIESMKLEMALKAPRDGIVEALHFGLGQSFERDAVLAVLSSLEG